LVILSAPPIHKNRCKPPGKKGGKKFFPERGHGKKTVLSSCGNGKGETKAVYIRGRSSSRKKKKTEASSFSYPLPQKRKRKKKK